MTASKPDSTEVANRLKQTIEYVQDCERRVMKGEIMDLQGLDRNVIEICEAITTLPEGEGRALEKQMSKLIDGLEGLATSMKAQQDKMTAVGGR
jgi:hypothetical protein